MTAALSLTAAGRAALADAGNVGMSAVQFRKLALGAGIRQPADDDDARVALRDQRNSEAVVGSDTTPGRIAFRADYAPTQNYSVSEVGLIARVGDAGNEFLLAYWATDDVANAVAAAAVGTALVLAAIVEVASSDADIDVTPALTVSVGVPADVVRTAELNAAIAALHIPPAPPYASQATPGLTRFASLAEARAGLVTDEAVTPAGLAARIADLLGSAPATLDTIEELATALENNPNVIDALNTAIANRATVAALAALAARVDTLEDEPMGRRMTVARLAANLDSDAIAVNPGRTTVVTASRQVRAGSYVLVSGAFSSTVGAPSGNLELQGRFGGAGAWSTVDWDVTGYQNLLLDFRFGDLAFAERLRPDDDGEARDGALVFGPAPAAGLVEVRFVAWWNPRVAGRVIYAAPAGLWNSFSGAFTPERAGGRGTLLALTEVPA